MTRTSRSRGSSRARAAWTRSSSSSRIRARLGVEPSAARQAAARRCAEASAIGGSAGTSRSNAPPLGDDVVAVELDQPEPGHLAEPGVERQGAVAEVAREPQGRVGQRLLDDVGGVNPRGQPPVDPDGDHPPEPIAMPGQEFGPGRRVAEPGRPEQLVGIGRRRGASERPRFLIYAGNRGNSTVFVTRDSRWNGSRESHAGIGAAAYSAHPAAVRSSDRLDRLERPAARASPDAARTPVPRDRRSPACPRPPPEPVPPVGLPSTPDTDEVASMSRNPGIAGSPRWSSLMALALAPWRPWRPWRRSPPRSRRRTSPRAEKKAEKKAERKEPRPPRADGLRPVPHGHDQGPAPRDNNAMKGIAIKLGAEAGSEAAVCFDTDLLRVSAGWTGGFLKLTGTPFDGSHGSWPEVNGDQVFGTKPGPGWAQGRRLQGPPPRAVRPPAGRLGQVQGAVPERRPASCSPTPSATTPVLEMPWVEGRRHRVAGHHPDLQRRPDRPGR